LKVICGDEVNCGRTFGVGIYLYDVILWYVIAQAGMGGGFWQSRQSFLILSDLITAFGIFSMICFDVLTILAAKSTNLRLTVAA
jgi:hypothetical protein